MTVPLKQHSEERRQIMRMLYKEACKCQTVRGASVLLSVKRWLDDGSTVYEGVDELWQVADLDEEKATAENDG